MRVLRQTFTWLPAWRHNAQVFLDDARSEAVRVAVRDGRIVGLAAFDPRSRFLHSLYVAERGGGVGKALLDHVLAECRGRLHLKCQEANRRAQAFYAREGFRIIEHGQDPWPGSVAWVRMAR